MGESTLDPGACRVLYVADANLLDDSVEAAADRALLRALAGLGLPCEAVCRFAVPGGDGADPGPWLAERGWGSDPAGGPAGFVLPDDPAGAALRVYAGGIPVTLFRGPPAGDDAGRAGFLGLTETALGRSRPTVVVARPGPSLVGVLSAARAREVATAVLQSDATLRDPAPYRDADVVLTPTRLAADYLREAFGLPCAHLPPVAAGGPPAAPPPGGGAVVFDGTAPGTGLAVFVQVAGEVSRRRPGMTFVVLGGNGSVPIPGGTDAIRCVPSRAPGRLWESALVCLAPALGWEHTPLTALAALAHGVPVVASDRGALPELLDGAGPLLALPEGLTATAPARLGPDVLTPWVDAVLRIADDPDYAAQLRALATEAGGRWAADALAPRYARFFAGLASRRPRAGAAATANGSGNGTAVGHKPAGLRRLAVANPWPETRPEDAAPGREQGGLGAGTDQTLARVLSPKTRLVVELGSWLGLSTRYIADHAPHATVVSVDHWRGNPEHLARDEYRALLPRLFETFQARCWDYRDRVVPLRADSLDGLRAVAAEGLRPDLVYVDAEHSYEAVSAELALARELFPDAALAGDDYDWEGVRRAVNEFAGRHGLVIDRSGARGWRLLEGWRAADAGQPPPGRGQWVVLVPHLNGIEWECEQALRQLEGAGVRVVRRGGCSAIDVARNELLSDALHDGAEAVLFVDSDIGFDPADALRLFARPEPVISAVYPKKGMRELATVFADGVTEVLFGQDAAGPYPVKYAATGFLRIRAGVLRRMIDGLRLPLCNTHWGRGVWPFFQPLVVPHGPGKWHYLGEDWAFSHRLQQIGETPLADTTIRLWHWGRYGFGWEDAGSMKERFRSYTYHLSGS